MIPLVSGGILPSTGLQLPWRPSSAGRIPNTSQIFLAISLLSTFVSWWKMPRWRNQTGCPTLRQWRGPSRVSPRLDTAFGELRGETGACWPRWRVESTCQEGSTPRRTFKPWRTSRRRDSDFCQSIEVRTWQTFVDKILVWWFLLLYLSFPKLLITKMLTFLSFLNNFSRASTPMLCSMTNGVISNFIRLFVSLGSVPVEAGGWSGDRSHQTCSYRSVHLNNVVPHWILYIKFHENLIYFHVLSECPWYWLLASENYPPVALWRSVFLQMW